VQTGRLYGPGLHNRYDETIGTSLGRAVGSEDCLYLNIWTPAAPAVAPRPGRAGFGSMRMPPRRN